MIKFAYPSLLFLLIPLVIFLVYLYFRQRRAILWVSTNVSKRFADQLTLYSPFTLKLHLVLLFVMGCLILVAASKPMVFHIVEVEKVKGNIMIVIDGSSSMLAGDTIAHPKTKKKPYDRLEQAQNFAQELVDALPEYAFGLMTFSGSAVTHSLPTTDHIEIKRAIQTIKTHAFDDSGSNLQAVLKELLRLAANKEEGTFQVLIIGDGEIPEESEVDYSQELSALASGGIVVHTVGVGTETGSGVNFFIWYSKAKKKDSSNSKDDSTGQREETSRKVIKNITTKRMDIHYAKISRETNGEHVILEYEKSSFSGWTEPIENAIGKTHTDSKQKEKVAGEKDISGSFLLAFLLLFLGDRVFWKIKGSSINTKNVI
jgi:hypothetical protein